MNSERGLTFLEATVLIGIVAVLLAVSAGLYSQIFVRQKQLDEKAEMVNLAGQLSIMRQSTSICSCNVRRLPTFEIKTTGAYKAGVPSLQIWDAACSSATSTLIATEKSGLTPGRTVKARSIDFGDLIRITDSIFKLDLKVSLASVGEDKLIEKPLELKNILVYTQADPPSEPSSSRRRIIGCVPFTGPGEHLLLVDQKPTGGSGGKCQAFKWNARSFTRALIDDHGIVDAPRETDGTFAAALRDIPLRPGTYSCELTAPVNYFWSGSQARLVNADTGDTLLYGTTEATGSPQPALMRSIVKGRFTLLAPTRVRLESFVSTNRSAPMNLTETCLGESAHSGAPEVYSTLDCWRLP